MARVTVEDCLEQVENRFALVHAATKRAKMLYKGSQPAVDCDNREIVTALREIAAGKTKIAEPEETKKGKRKH